MLPRIREVKPLPDYCLRIVFDDGRKVLYDVKENAYMDLDSLIATGQSAWGYFEERIHPFLFLFSIHPMHLRGHVKYTFRELDAQAGAFVDELVQELQHKVVRVTRL